MEYSIPFPIPHTNHDRLTLSASIVQAMTRTGMLKRNHLVYDKCVEYDTPLVVTMGGGYSKPFGKSVAAHADVFRSAAYRFGGAPVGVKRK
jgi:hypothetical protein|tara:strand:+ start:2322 stop:2594 length:273 start_codon:yes stop_codon:yes gene_type:complete